MVPKHKKVTHNVEPCATRESRDSTREEYPPLRSTREMSFCRAQEVNLCKKKMELQTFLAVWRHGKIFGVCGGFFSRHHVMPRENCVYRKIPIASQYIEVMRQTTTNLDNLDESSIDDFGTWTEMTLSLKVGPDPRDSAS